MVILPIYSFIMMIVSINTHMNWQDILLTLLLFALGLFIGWLQARGVSIKDDGKSDKYGRHIIKIRRNWPYLVGWIFIFALNIGMQVYFGKHLDVEDLSSDLVIDLLKDASSAFFIFWHSGRLLPCSFWCTMNRLFCWLLFRFWSRAAAGGFSIRLRVSDFRFWWKKL